DVHHSRVTALVHVGEGLLGWGRVAVGHAVSLPADVGHLDALAGAGGGLRAHLRVAVRARAPRPVDQRPDLLVARACAHRAAEVDALRGEEAGVEAALRGEARARAGAAEGLRHAGDEPHLARAV